MLKRNGFTLLETLIAMVIMSTALILLTSSWGGSFMRVRKSQLQYEVGMLLERKMTEIKLEYEDKPLDEIPEEKSDDFSGYPKYSWKMTSRELTLPDIASSLTAKEGGANQMLMMVIKQMTEALQKTVKEVTVTVIYKSTPRNLEFSATTYFVDFNKDVPLGPGM